MIRIKNYGQYFIELKKPGSAAVANDVDAFVVPTDGYIAAIFAAFGLMGTDGTGAPTQDIRVDIKQNGSSVFSGANPYISWAHAGQLGTANVSTQPSTYGTSIGTNPIKVSKGDRIQIDVLQILNGTNPVQPIDLSVSLVMHRKFQSPPKGGTLTGQVSDLD